VSEIESDIAVLKAQANETHQMVKDIHKAIWVGNGKPSITSRLDLIEEGERRRSQAASRRDTKSNIVLSAVVGVVVVQLASLIF